MTVLGPQEPQAAAPLQKWKPKPCVLTAKQQQQWDAAKIRFLRNQPFFSFIMMEKAELIFTKDIPTAATDCVSVIAINPDYFENMTPQHMEYALCHEVGHIIYEHGQRSKAAETVGAIMGVRFHHGAANIAQDLRINNDLDTSGCGTRHKDWLHDPNVQDHETWEIIYERIFKNNPPPPGRGGKPGQGGSSAPGGQPGDGRGDEDCTGPFTGRGFDEHLPPPVDPKTGQPVKPDESGMKETILQAAAFAKAQGKMPAGFQRFVDELAAPQVPWEDHLMAMLCALLGFSDLSYQRPHRRRVAISFGGFQQVWPGMAGKNAGELWVGGDTSGSMGKPEMTLAASEICGIITLARPKSVHLAWCDAEVHRVDEIHDVEGLEEALRAGIPGGGGTDFCPVFEEIRKRGATPSALVFITDGYGAFPDEAPSYPVIWCSTTPKGDVTYPFGEVVYVTVR